MVCIQQVKLFCGDGAVRDVLCVLLYSSMVCILNLNGLLLLLLLRPLSYSNGVCIQIRWLWRGGMVYIIYGFFF